MNNDRSKNRRFCSYTGCNSDRLKTRNGAISFFSFPIKDTERCSIWISNSGREEFRYLNPRELSEKRLCELHFERVMFSSDFKTNLTKRAIPKYWQPQELIQIDDDEDEGDHESENRSACNGSFDNDTPVVPVNGLAPESENSENRLTLVNGNSSNNSVIIEENNIANGRSAEEQVQLGSAPVGLQPTGNPGTIQKKRAEKFTSPNGPPNKKKTKFHNYPQLPTSQADFYYQQCPSAEETNNSFPDHLDGELPLFVQQNLIDPMVEDHANSEISEPESKKRKLNNNNDLSDQMRDAMKHLKNITALLTNTEDEFELFGKSVALQLKKMSVCTALRVQAKIQQLLSENRIREIMKKDNVDKTNTSDNNSEDSKEDEKDVEEDQDEVDQPASPPLSLTCASEASDNVAST